MCYSTKVLNKLVDVPYVMYICLQPWFQGMKNEQIYGLTISMDGKTETYRNVIHVITYFCFRFNRKWQITHC